MQRTTSFPPFVSPAGRAEPIHPRQDSLPSIDEFLDELPPIEDFIAVEPAESYEYPEPHAAAPDEGIAGLPVATGIPAAAPEGWAPAEFQSYDWDSLAALTRQGQRQTAAESWSDADWPSPSEVPPTADEVANALDGIARRIRSGELVIENLYGTQPEAAMAAALAILLRMRG